MPQRKKSKTKKQMKKSIDSLWKSLQEEKVKHAKASDMVGRLKLRLQASHFAEHCMREDIAALNDAVGTMQNREEHASEVMADLISNLT